MASVKVSADADGTYEIGTDAGSVVKGIDYFGGALELTSLLMRAELLGDTAAAAELEGRGLEPPTLTPDPAPLPGQH